MEAAPENRTKTVPRLSMLIWSILLFLFAIVYGIIEETGRFAEITLENFFSVTWREGLTPIQTIWDVQVFWGELWFFLFVAVLMAGIWIYRAQPVDSGSMTTDSRKNGHIFIISAVVVAAIIIAMAISYPLMDVPPIDVWNNWYSTHMAYQLPVFPSLIASMLLLVAPMKSLGKRRIDSDEGLDDSDLGALNLKRPKIPLVLWIVALVLWIIMSANTLWHPHALTNLEVQVFTWITTLSFPMIFFTFTMTQMLKRPPRPGDGRRNRVWREFLILLVTLMIFIGLMLFIAFYVPQIGADQMGSIWMHWWWPISHMPSYIFSAALAVGIVTGYRMIRERSDIRAANGNDTTFMSRVINLNRRIKSADVNMSRVRQVSVAAILSVMVAIPTFGIAQYAVSSDPDMVLVNRLGYMPDSPKRVVFQASSRKDSIPDTGSFSVRDSETKSEVYSGVLERFGSRKYYTHWYMNGTFTDFASVGDYYIECTVGGSVYTSDIFEISDSVYNITRERAVDFFYYQRDGDVNEIIDGYTGHKSHVNDALLFSGDEEFDFNYPYNTREHAVAGNLIYKNLSGGWHDAGDYNKYNSWYQTQWFCTHALNYAWENANSTFHTGLSNKYDTAAPDVLEEALWGANFLVRMTDTSETGIHPWSRGMIIENVIGWNWKTNDSALMSYWGPPHLDTQRVGGSNRHEGYDYSSDGAMPWGWAGLSTAYGFAGVLLETARLIDNYRAAHPDWNYPGWSVNTTVLRDTAFLINSTYDGLLPFRSHGGVYANRLIFEEEAAKLSGDWSAADSWALENITRDGNIWLSGWHSAYMLSTLLSYYIENGRTIPGEVTSLAQNFYNTVYPNYYHGPFTVLNTIITEEPRLFGGSYLNGRWDHHGLHNTDMLSYMYLLALIGEVLPGDVRHELVQYELDFLFGVNPLGLVQMDAVSERTDFVPQIHHRYSYAYYPSGRVPGGIINGIRNVQPTKDWAIYNGIYEWAEEEPFEEAIKDDIMSFRWNMTGIPEQAWVNDWPGNPLCGDGVSSGSNEIWIPHNAFFLHMMTAYNNYVA